MGRIRKGSIPGVTTAVLAAAAVVGPAAAQEYGTMDGARLYGEACAACHGPDGRGPDAGRLGFEVVPPDFTECAFASREPDGDWVAVAHQGGPVRGFSRRMPAFGGVLRPEDLQRVMDHVRTMCLDGSWPRGELNLPRALVTEKAFPEDEAVYEVATPLSGPGAWSSAVVYERRIGSRTQWEVVLPFDVVRTADDSGWASGPGDVVLGLKRVVHSNLPAGRILSLGAEAKLPTGDADRGLGTGSAVAEGFVSYGQLVGAAGFIQLQGVVERPFDTEGGETEGQLRGAVGVTLTEGPWGRAWSPMLEVVAGRAFEDGADTEVDLIPQLHLTLNTRQHVMLNVGVRVPTGEGPSRLLVSLLWDWYDGGFLEGW